MTFENIEVAGIANAIRGMRNPMMSHGKSDTAFDARRDGASDAGEVSFGDACVIGAEDEKLANALIAGGSPHRKFLRQIFVSVDICKAPAYWMHEFATYKVGTTLDCSSTMHKITSRPLTSEDFETPETMVERVILGDTIEALNRTREGYLNAKKCGDALIAEEFFRAMKRMLPHSYLYERMTWTANYEVLRNIRYWRHKHRLPAWHTFCRDFIDRLPHSEWLRECADGAEAVVVKP